MSPYEFFFLKKKLKKKIPVSKHIKQDLNFRHTSITWKTTTFYIYSPRKKYHVASPPEINSSRRP